MIETSKHFVNVNTMSEPLADKSIIRTARTSQFVVASMAMGAAVFLLVTLVGKLGGQANGPPIISYIAIFFSAGALAARVIVPAAFVRSARSQIVRGTWRPAVKQPLGAMSADESMDDEEKLAYVFQTKIILAAAMLEGAAFFALVAYLLEGQAMSLVAAGVLILGIVLPFPTRGSVAQWIEGELREIKQLKQLE